jgi:CO/xanthine dehydrogenase FAD-binding subunit
MVATVSAYWRPDSTDRAFELLDRPGALVLGGGTTLNEHPPGEPVEVVDLQALHLNGIEHLTDGSVRIGAMATYHQIAGSAAVPTVIRDAARHEQPSTLRSQATLGGCIARGDRDSELLATLLVHETVVHFARRDETYDRPLDDVLAGLPLPSGTIVTGVSLDTTGVAAVARAARTRADIPIVAVVVRVVDGVRRAAVTGVAPTPMLVTDVDVIAPTGDFRGSPEYRTALVHTLLSRATEAVG